QVGTYINRLAVNALRAAGFEEKAQEVSDRDPAFLTRVVADAIVAKEERGEDASQLRRILEFFEPDGGERVLAEQRQLRLARDLPFRSQWQLSEFTYEDRKSVV